MSYEENHRIGGDGGSTIVFISKKIRDKPELKIKSHSNTRSKL